MGQSRSLSVRPLWSTTPCAMGVNVGSPSQSCRLWPSPGLMSLAKHIWNFPINPIPQLLAFLRRPLTIRKNQSLLSEFSGASGGAVPHCS